MKSAIRKFYHRRDLVVFVFLVFFFSRLPHALGESEKQNQAVRQEETISGIEQSHESSENLESKKEARRAPSVLFGGSLISTFRDYNQIDNQKIKEDFLKWSWKQDLYLWSYLNYQATHSVLARFLMSTINRDTGPTYTGVGNDSQGPDIQALYYELNLEPVFQAPLKITTGRQHFFLGRGIAYSAFDDGLQIENHFGSFRQKHFAALSPPHSDNIDYSAPGFDKEGQRAFFGSETVYSGFEDIALYAYGLIQRDKSSQIPEDPRQNYHYKSSYLGLGATWSPDKHLKIGSEIIREGGQSYTDVLRVPLRKTRVQSLGAALNINYAFEGDWHPVLDLDYAYGSGEETRTSVTNTDGGSTRSRDNNFLYFGYYLAGYAFQPRLSNIHIVSAGVSTKPFPEIPFFRRIILGTKYYVFRKDRESGGTSDLESTNASRDLGEEWDVYLHWKIRENWSAIFRSGVFWPGGSFPDEQRDNTTYSSVSLSWNF
ncbi:MAG: alginate export family protein [Candidatus Omnitrophica bacterium]|nr:alginate export family protein [Candidatus Omnitrophota bacterium]